MKISINNLLKVLQSSNRYAALILFAIPFLVFSPSLFNDYNLDDELVTRNHRLTSKGISAIPEIYSSPYYEDDMGYSYGYRPTVLASFAIEHELFRESPFVGHLINLLLYSLTVVVIFLLTLKLFPSQWWVAFGAATLFAVHPIHTEVVASLKNRDEILAMLFSISALYGFVMARVEKWVFWHLLLLVGVYLSITSKFTGIYIFSWLPLFLKFKQIKAVFRYPLYSIISVIVFFVLQIRQSNSDAWEYAVLLMFFYCILDLFSHNSVKLLLSATRNLTKKAMDSLSRFTDRTATLIERVIQYVRIKIASPFKYFLGKLTETLSLIPKSTLNHLQKTQHILGMDSGLFWVSIVLVTLSWNPLTLALVLVFPWIWSLIPEDVRTFSKSFRLPLVFLTAFITSTDLFTPFLVSFYFGKRTLNEHKNDESSFVGHLLWCLLVGFDIFILGDAGGFTDRVIFSVFTTFLLAQPLAAIFFRVNSSGKKVVFHLFLLTLSIPTLWLFTNKVEAVFILVFINLLMLIGFLTAHYQTSRLIKFSRKALIVVVGLFCLPVVFNLADTILNSFGEARVSIEKLMHSENFEGFTTKLSEKESDRLLETASQIAIYSAYISAVYQSGQEQIEQLRLPVILSGDTGLTNSGSSNNRPLEYVENPTVKNFKFSVQLGTAFVCTYWILSKTIIPFPQSFYYGYNEVPVHNLLEQKTLRSMGISLSVLIIIITLPAVRKRKFLPIVLGLAFWLGAAFLFSGLIEALPGLLAERFTYLGSLGFCLALSAFLQLILKKCKPLCIALVALSIILPASAFSYERTTLWKNKLTLMRNDIKHVPNSAQGHNLLAHALMEKAMDKNANINAIEREELTLEAKGHFERAAEIYPQFFNAWVDLGKVNEVLNKPEQAISAFEKAAEIDSSYNPLFNWIGRNAESIGKFELAESNYEVYLTYYPIQFEAYDNLARVLFKQQKFEECISVCEQYLQIDPNNQTFIGNINYMKNQLAKIDSVATEMN